MKTLIFYLLLLQSIIWGPLSAQGVLASLPEGEQDAIEAIALYPADERSAVLMVAQHPELIVRMDQLRNATEASFKTLISGVPEEDQKKIYNLSRYPALMDEMAKRDEQLSHRDMEALLLNYPMEIREDARHLNQKYFSLLRDIQVLYDRTENDFQLILNGYPEEAQEAARQLAGLPAILSVLSEHMSMTVLLGDIYRQKPQQLNHELDSLNVVLAEQQARELEEWKKELEENPEAMSEYESAAREFAAEEPEYDDDVYDGPIPDRYREDVYIQHVWRPYSYWFGWPSWYTYECWYPYPWWYHWGYYYGPGRVIVIVGLPSNFFLDWHFRHHHHFYHYPHFTDHLFRHYYGPRHYGARVQPVLRQWEQEHRDQLPSNWMNDDPGRVNRIRELGKFKMEYDDLVKVTREKAPTEREYLRSQADRYPSLKPVLKEKPEPPRSEPPAQVPKTRQDQPVQEPGEKVIRKDMPRQEEIDRAKERHENTWDRSRTTPPPKEPSPGVTPSKREQPKSQPKSPPRTKPVKKDPEKKVPDPKAPARKKDAPDIE